MMQTSINSFDMSSWMPRTDDTSPLIQNSFKLFLYTPHQNIWKIYLDDVLSMIEHVLRAQTLIRHPSNPVGSIHLDAHNIKKRYVKIIKYQEPLTYQKEIRFVQNLKHGNTHSHWIRQYKLHSDLIPHFGEHDREGITNTLSINRSSHASCFLIHWLNLPFNKIGPHHDHHNTGIIHDTSHGIPIQSSTHITRISSIDIAFLMPGMRINGAYSYSTTDSCVATLSTDHIDISKRIYLSNHPLALSITHPQQSSSS